MEVSGTVFFYILIFIPARSSSLFPQIPRFVSHITTAIFLSSRRQLLKKLTFPTPAIPKLSTHHLPANKKKNSYMRCHQGFSHGRRNLTEPIADQLAARQTEPTVNRQKKVIISQNRPPTEWLQSDRTDRELAPVLGVV